MFAHNKRLQYTVRVSETNPGLANLLLEQFGGPQGELVRYVEKPVYSYRVSMGVNCFRADVVRYLPAGERRDMPELIQEIVQAGERVLCPEPACYWLDIGRHADYENAIEVFETRRGEFLGGPCES